MSVDTLKINEALKNLQSKLIACSKKSSMRIEELRKNKADLIRSHEKQTAVPTDNKQAKESKSEAEDFGQKMVSNAEMRLSEDEFKKKVERMEFNIAWEEDQVKRLHLALKNTYEIEAQPKSIQTHYQSLFNLGDRYFDTSNDVPGTKGPLDMVLDMHQVLAGLRIEDARQGLFQEIVNFLKLFNINQTAEKKVTRENKMSAENQIKSYGLEITRVAQANNNKSLKTTLMAYSQKCLTNIEVYKSEIVNAEREAANYYRPLYYTKKWEAFIKETEKDISFEQDQYTKIFNCMQLLSEIDANPDSIHEHCHTLFSLADSYRDSSDHNPPKGPDVHQVLAGLYIEDIRSDLFRETISFLRLFDIKKQADKKVSCEANPEFNREQKATSNTVAGIGSTTNSVVAPALGSGLGSVAIKPPAQTVESRPVASSPAVTFALNATQEKSKDSLQNIANGMSGSKNANPDLSTDKCIVM